MHAANFLLAVLPLVAASSYDQDGLWALQTEHLQMSEWTDQLTSRNQTESVLQTRKSKTDHTIYAPKWIACEPLPSFVRPAIGISQAERNWVNKRSVKSTAALKDWLLRTDPGFPVTNLPIIGLATSGGGYRSMLVGAGVVKGLDARDSHSSVAGLYQALTYHAGLSGGSWLLSSLSGHNWPTITSLSTGLWSATVKHRWGLINHLLSDDTGKYQREKERAGFPTSDTDRWGLSLTHQLLGSGGEDAQRHTVSNLAELSNFTDATVPYPIITALGVNTSHGHCWPEAHATQYEIHPFEFGSWDEGIAAFTPTEHLGSPLSNGQPTNLCASGFDALPFVFGTSSSLFNLRCGKHKTTAIQFMSDILDGLAKKVHINATFDKTKKDSYAYYPNPFLNYEGSPHVKKMKTLDLVDGGEADQNNPIWPFLHRPHVGVLIVNDNSRDTKKGWPDGSEIYHTFQQAQRAGLSRMPDIPPPAEFAAKGLDKKPAFFGCGDLGELTIVWLPNAKYNYKSNTDTAKREYEPKEIAGMIGNGEKIASKGDDKEWPKCLGCAITRKSGAAVPAFCEDCYKEYCYN